jgi:hypothetical protein
MKKTIDDITDKKKEMIYILEVVARKVRTITYKHLCEIAEFPFENLQDYKKLRHILNSIDQETYNKQGILLTSLVISQNCGVPGQGFFTNVMNMDIDMGYNKIIFYAKELEKVYEYYKK